MLVRSIFAVFLWWAAVFPAMAAAGTPPRAEDVFVLSTSRTPTGALELRWTIAPANYLYRDKLAATTMDGRPLTLTTPPGETKDDPNFGPTEIYRGVTTAGIAADQLPEKGAIRVSFQGCAEAGICYPPVADVVDLAELTVSRAKPAIAASASTGSLPVVLSAPRPAPATASGSSQFTGRLPLVFMSFLGLGLLLALTPCVFPMIPILSGMLAGSGERLSPSRAFALSSSYALAMGMAYGVLGIVVAWSGQNLQTALQTPIALGAMAAVLFALALSMFGLYDLQLPPALAARFSGRPGRAGSIAGSVALGFGSALIVGPCVTPPLAAALVYVASTGDVMRGGLALFALGFGMGLPLIAFGTLGGSLLPKSGPWLAGVKQVFGLIFIALSISMITRLMTPTLAVGAWGAFAVVTGGAMAWSNGAFARFARPAGVLGIIYGAILLVGFAAGGLDPLRPLEVFAHSIAIGPRVAITSRPDFDKAVAEARSSNRPILVDFTADWCTTCKDIDRNVLSDPAIQARLRDVAFLRVDVTAQTAEMQRLMDAFGVVGPPTMFMLDANTGTEIGGSRSIGDLSVQDFGVMLARAGA